VNLGFGLALAVLVASALPAAGDNLFIEDQKPTEYLAKDRLIGINVHDGEGKIVGHVDDLIIDGDNKIAGALIAVGGIAGIGQKKIAVPFDYLSIEATDKGIQITLPIATKEALAAAPVYKRAQPARGWLQRAAEKGREIRDTGKDAYDKAKEKAAPTLEKAKEAAKNAYEQAGPALEKAKAAAQQVIDEAKHAAKPADAPPVDPPKN